jgi:GNAT superfamily N-acetyltransferase
MVQTLSPLIREATAIDAESIARVRVASWRASYRGIIDDAYLDALSVDAGRDRYLRTFDPAPAAGFTRVAADDDGRVVGFATGGVARGPAAARRQGEVWMIYLMPDAQRHGLGTRLMRSMARGLDRRGLGSMVVWALARNDPENWLSGVDPALIATNDGAFKHHLDRYKYSQRHGSDPLAHRSAAFEILRGHESRLAGRTHFHGVARSFTDIALFPFVRQFMATDPAWFAAHPLPAVQAWLAHHLASPLFVSAMAR